MTAKKEDKKAAKKPLKKGPDIKKCRGAMRDVLTEQIDSAKQQGDEYTEKTFSKALKKLEKKWQKEDEKKD